MSATLLREEIVVQAKSKSGKGVMSEKEVWFNAGKGVDLSGIQKGEKIQVNYLQGSEGGNFVHSFTRIGAAPALPTNDGAAVIPAGVEQPAPALVAPVFNQTPVAPATKPPFKKWAKKSDDNQMTKEDWARKDYGASKGGVAHDAAAIVASMAAMKTTDEVLALYDQVFKHILKTVTEA